MYDDNRSAQAMPKLLEEACRFKTKYHPEECDKRQVDVKEALQTRKKVFETLIEKNFLEDINVDVDKTDELVKILDATVILLEGGNDLDLTILDNPVDESGNRSRQNSESAAVVTPVKSEKSEANENGKDDSISESENKDEEDKKEEAKVEQEEDKSDPKDLEMSITPEQEELKKKAMEYQKQQEEAAAEAKAQRRKKKGLRKKSDYSYESDSESGSESGSDWDDTEPAPPGLEEDTAGAGAPPQEKPEKKEEAENTPEEKEKDASETDNKTKEEGEAKEEADPIEEQEEKPRPLHRTNSIFLRNLAPTITKQEVEAMCRRYPGFKRVALQDPQPERHFFRRGWVTFSKESNIKEICWNFNNIRLRDSELGATLNRELKLRVRAANGLTVHKQVMRNDIKIAAKIIQTLDNKWSLWIDEEEEKKDAEKEPSFGFVSKNPVLKNITDFLVDEGSFEEDELIGESDEEKKEANPEITIEKDDSLCKALDKMILYLRIIHSVDYYSANEYPNEDEMPHRCGIMHARGTPPGSTAKITQTDVNEWMTSFESKIKPFMETSQKVPDVEAIQFGKKDPDSEVEKFVQANTQELAKDKWLCPISGKKFKGPEFVRKHIFNKHGEKIEEVKQEVAYFNNYLIDPKRPSLPEHPSSRPKPPPPPPPPPQASPQPPPAPMMTSPFQGRLGYGGGYQNPFPVRDSRPPPDNYRRGGPPSRPYRRSDPRQLIQYTDLDAPDDGDIF